MPKMDTSKGNRRLSARRVRKALGSTGRRLRDVPGPSTNPATNLLIADIGFRAAGTLFRRSMERGLLRLKFPPEEARAVVEGRTLGATLLSAAVARVATRSIPGALLVTGGLIAKTIVDRSLSRRKSQREGTRQLEEQAENAD